MEGMLAWQLWLSVHCSRYNTLQLLRLFHLS